MTADPASVACGTPVTAVRDTLENEPIHHLPVVDDGKLVGIVSTADLLKLYLLDDGPASASSLVVDDIMQHKLVVLVESSTLRDAAEKLSAGSFHSLPVVDADHRLIGIVTSTDLIDYLLSQLPRGDGTLNELSPAALLTRHKILEEVWRAAERYERSGHAEREHSLLQKALAKARAGDESLTL